MSESYSSTLKRALCEKSARAFGFSASDTPLADDCCKLSFFSALVLFGTSRKNGRISFQSKNREVADLFFSMAAAFYSLSPTEQNGALTLADDEAFHRVLRAANAESVGERYSLPLSVCGACQGYFLRGAFLCTGTMANPENSHQLNLFCAPYAEELLPTLTEADYNFRKSTRRKKSYLYLKKGSDIEDFLARIGAESFALELINREIERSVRADVNRQNNFDTANISRSSLFLSRLDDAIHTLSERDATESLPEGLKEVIRLRAAYPDDTLTELGLRALPPLSKSGIHHRVKKILNLATDKEF